MEKLPLVSLITINYNQPDVTCAMLETVKRLTYPNLEVFVVDNGSREDDTGRFRAILPDANIIIIKKNVGFAGGNNAAVPQAKGDYIFFVNNDTELPPDLIEHLVEPFQKIKDVGMVCPKIIYYDPPQLIQYAGYTEINPFTARNSTVGQFEVDKGQYDKGGFTSYAHGAAMLVSKEAIQKAGMMPEFFYLYYEELDWSQLIKNAGFKIYYQPKGKIFHKESVTIGRMSPEKIYYVTRNRILFMRRHAQAWQLMLFAPFFTFITLPKNVLMYLLKGETMLAKQFVRAALWNLSHKAPKPAAA